MYHKILVAYDGSEQSGAAMREAAMRVRKHGGEVTALHVVYFDAEEFGSAHSEHDKRVASGQRMCERIKDEVMAETGVPIQTRIVEGEPHTAILAAAAEVSADLIVMGTHGRAGLTRLILGSVASGVIVGSSVDVLVVKRGCGACSGSYGSMLLPFDNSGPGRKALKAACGLAGADGAGITALYVIPRYEEMIGFFKTEAMKDNMRTEAGRILGDAASMALACGRSISTEVLEGSAPESIVECAARRQADLIVMGSHGWKGVNRALIGSTTERVIVLADSPVLVVRS